MSKYYIVPRPGYAVEDIELTGFNYENSLIVKISNGLWVEIHRYTPENAERYNAEPHPSFFTRRVVFDIEGRGLPLEPPIMADYAADGWDPFKQIICMLAEERAPTRKDILSYILVEKKYLPNSNYYRWYISELVDYLTNQGWLNYEDGFYTLGERSRPIGQMRIKLRDGVNPKLDQILKAIESGADTFGKVSDYMIKTLGWVEWDVVTKESAETKMRKYINYLKVEGYIREVVKDKYVVVKPLEVR